MTTENETEIEITVTETVAQQEQETEQRDPVYLQFVKRLMDAAGALGVRLEEKKGWMNLSGTNGHRIDIQKSQTKLPVVYCTLEPETCGGTSLSKPNGRLRCELPRDPIAVAKVLPLLVDASNPIAPAKRGKGGGQKKVPTLDELLSAKTAPVVEESSTSEA